MPPLTLFLAAALLTACAGEPPVLGLAEGRLAPCPTSSNCVSSMEEGPRRVEPLPGVAAERVRALLARHPDARVVRDEPGYLRAEFRSTLGFVDDVEFVFPAGGGPVHVRSASRLGKYDFGVNRRRVEILRAELAAPRP